MPNDQHISLQIRFDRVRTVTIDANQFIYCTCGYCQRFLLPCRHICAVLNDILYLEPPMFHIRWYKLFNYYYRNKLSLLMVPESNEVLEELLKVTLVKGN